VKKRVTLVVGIAMAAGLGTCSPAAAQGTPVGGHGNHYYLAGAGNYSGKAAQDFVYGNPDDEVYFGDFVGADGQFGGDGQDDAMVRRGNQFTVRGQGGRSFFYGDPGDTVLVGDWDGDGTDTLAVRRGNTYYVKNDIDTGVADTTFVYGDPSDVVLVGNWDGQWEEGPSIDPGTPGPRVRHSTTDTLMVRRGAHFFLRNELTSGTADFDFIYGNPDDEVLVGDWNDYVSIVGRIEQDSDGADQIAVRRGNVYYYCEDMHHYAGRSGTGIDAIRTVVYGNATDTAFSARLPTSYNSPTYFIHGDALAVRR